LWGATIITSQKADILPELWPMLAFLLAALALSLLRYRRTLD